MKIGDLIKYRDWRQGDLPVEAVDENAREWNSTGVVYWIGEDQFGSGLEPAVSFLNQRGQMIRAAQRDVEVISARAS